MMSDRRLVQIVLLDEAATGHDEMNRYGYILDDWPQVPGFITLAEGQLLGTLDYVEDPGYMGHFLDDLLVENQPVHRPVHQIYALFETGKTLAEVVRDHKKAIAEAQA